MFRVTLTPRTRSNLKYMCDILINILSILIHGDISLPDATSFDWTVLQNAL